MAGSEGALADLRKAADLQPTSPYNALWLAGLSGDVERLKTFATRKDWTSQIVRCYLGQIDGEALLREASQGKTERERSEWLCEAHGYLGLLAERNDNETVAYNHYQACVATAIVDFAEYQWAKERLAQWAEGEQREERRSGEKRR